MELPGPRRIGMGWGLCPAPAFRHELFWDRQGPLRRHLEPRPGPQPLLRRRLGEHGKGWREVCGVWGGRQGEIHVDLPWELDPDYALGGLGPLGFAVSATPQISWGSSSTRWSICVAPGSGFTCRTEWILPVPCLILLVERTLEAPARSDFGEFPGSGTDDSKMSKAFENSPGGGKYGMEERMAVSGCGQWVFGRPSGVMAQESRRNSTAIASAVAAVVLAASTSLGVPIDLTDARPTVTGSTTLNTEEILTLGSSYWADFEGNVGTNEFDVSAYGEESPPEGFLLVEAGPFIVGSLEDELGRWGNEPQYEVRLTPDFYISKIEVTQTQWVSLMGSNPSDHSGCDDCPVETVSWCDAVEFCNAISARTAEPPCMR